MRWRCCSCCASTAAASTRPAASDRRSSPTPIPNALGQVWAFIVVPVVGAFGGLVLWLLIDDSTIDDTVFDDTFVETASDTVTGDH